jgi:SAM-dependent methyltransferase
MSDPAYVHGYDHREAARLADQAGTLVELLHADTEYPDGSLVLEPGCGTGAQTVTLATRSPGARFVSVDVSGSSLAEARKNLARAGVENVELVHGDIRSLDFAPGSFDHVFVCFVLEHLSEPSEMLRALVRLLRPGGTLTVIEGDHGSAYFHPDSDAARAVSAGLEDVHVSPRMVYVDDSRPDLVEGFTRRTFTAMIEGVREQAVEAGLLDAEAFDRGIRDLRRTAEGGGVFCYTFFKGVGRAPRR